MTSQKEIINDDDYRILSYLDGFQNRYKRYGLKRIFNRNKDCEYKGIAYRSFQFSKYFINLSKGDYSSLIKTNNFYQSFSTDYDVLLNDSEFSYSKRNSIIIIKTNIIGLDIWKYFIKHNLTKNDIVLNYPNQQALKEIIAPFNQKFEIIYKKIKI